MANGLIQEFQEAMDSMQEQFEDINKGIKGLTNVYENLFEEDNKNKE